MSKEVVEATEAAALSSDDENSFEDCQEAVDEDIEKIVNMVEDLEVAKDFSLEKLHIHFKQCLNNAEELTIADYLAGYREVYKFLTLLGSVFTWVAADVQTKINTLHEYNTGENKHQYQTIKQMIDYEIEQNMIFRNKRDDPSGSRTLLRLHRALEFVVAFLGKLKDLEDGDKIAPVSRDAYEQTLMKHHIWAVQKAAKLAMSLLPTKGGLVQKVCPGAEAEALVKVEADFVLAVESMNNVFVKAQIYYEEKDLLNIP